MVKLTSFCGCSFEFEYGVSTNTHFGHDIISKIYIENYPSIRSHYICNAHKELAVHNLIKKFIKIDLHNVSKNSFGDEIRYSVEEEETKFLIKIKEIMRYDSVLEAAQLVENIKKKVGLI